MRKEIITATLVTTMAITGCSELNAQGAERVPTPPTPKPLITSTPIPTEVNDILQPEIEVVKHTPTEFQIELPTGFSLPNLNLPIDTDRTLIIINAGTPIEMPTDFQMPIEGKLR